jgi:hypothetical protein
MLCRKSQDPNHRAEASEHIQKALSINPQSLQVRFIQWYIENCGKEEKDFIEQQTIFMNQAYP